MVQISDQGLGLYLSSLSFDSGWLSLVLFKSAVIFVSLLAPKLGFLACFSCWSVGSVSLFVSVCSLYIVCKFQVDSNIVHCRCIVVLFEQFFKWKQNIVSLLHCDFCISSVCFILKIYNLRKLQKHRFSFSYQCFSSSIHIWKNEKKFVL